MQKNTGLLPKLIPAMIRNDTMRMRLMAEGGVTHSRRGSTAAKQGLLEGLQS
jgi:hypothetical protein